MEPKLHQASSISGRFYRVHWNAGRKTAVAVSRPLRQARCEGRSDPRDSRCGETPQAHVLHRTGHAFEEQQGRAHFDGEKAGGLGRGRDGSDGLRGGRPADAVRTQLDLAGARPRHVLGADCSTALVCESRKLAVWESVVLPILPSAIRRDGPPEACGRKAHGDMRRCRRAGPPERWSARRRARATIVSVGLA